MLHCIDAGMHYNIVYNFSEGGLGGGSHHIITARSNTNEDVL